MFLLVPAYLGNPGQKAVVCVCSDDGNSHIDLPLCESLTDCLDVCGGQTISALSR